MSIEKYLPSKEFGKRFLVIIGIALVFFGINKLSVYIKNKNNNTEGTKAVLGKDYVNVSIGDVIEIDTDGDGIRDFEEILYGTDPDKTETTAGIPDTMVAEKIRQNAEAKLPEESENINQTSQFAGEFISSIIALDRAGLINEENKDKIADSFFEYIKNIPDKTIYTKEMFKTFPADSNLNKTGAYIKIISKIIASQIFENDDSIAIVGLALRKGEVDQLKRLKLNKTRYEKAIDSLKNIEVPMENIESHVTLINSLDAFARYIDDMGNIEEDPLPGFVAITRYNDNIKKYRKGVDGTINFLSPYINAVVN